LSSAADARLAVSVTAATAATIKRAEFIGLFLPG
jgi:hypothetical protein